MPELTIEARIAALEAGLDGVTPGPWRASHSVVLHGPSPGGAVLASTIDRNGGYNPADAAHIARCDPDTIKERPHRHCQGHPQFAGLAPDELAAVNHGRPAYDRDGQISSRAAPRSPAPHAEAGAKGGRGRKAPDNVRGFGNSAAYLVTRLKRDAPGIAEASPVANSAPLERWRSFEPATAPKPTPLRRPRRRSRPTSGLGDNLRDRRPAGALSMTLLHCAFSGCSKRSSTTMRICGRPKDGVTFGPLATIPGSALCRRGGIAPCTATRSSGALTAARSAPPMMAAGFNPKSITSMIDALGSPS